MSTIPSKITFNSPRQKEWGILKNLTLTPLNYGGITNSDGVAVTNYSTNCYKDCLDQARILLASGIGTLNIQVVEFVPYDYIMNPNV